MGFPLTVDQCGPRAGGDRQQHIRFIGAMFIVYAVLVFTAPAPVGGMRRSDSEGLPLTVDRCGPPAGGDGQHQHFRPHCSGPSRRTAEFRQ